jgi:hypothetical protein
MQKSTVALCASYVKLFTVTDIPFADIEPPEEGEDGGEQVFPAAHTMTVTHTLPPSTPKVSLRSFFNDQ